jgi:hypothetical protein
MLPEMLEPKRLHPASIAFYAFLLLLGLASAVFGAIQGEANVVLNGCGLMLFGWGGLLRTWSGLAAEVTAGIALLLCLAGVVVGGQEHWLVGVATGLLILACAVFPAGVWAWKRALREQPAEPLHSPPTGS